MIKITPELSAFKPLKYKKAKDLSEAKTYAQKVLNIKQFNVEDLELANQVNYTITKAYNKTVGQINPPDKVVYADITFDDGTKPQSDMFVSLEYKDNAYTCRTLFLCKNIFDNAGNMISLFLKKYGKNNQIEKDKHGFDKIILASKYKYENTLNRYYRLHQQGKLTTKSKHDFVGLLYHAQEAENSVIGALYNNPETRKTMERITHLENYDVADFDKKVRAYLLKIRRRNKIEFNPPLQVQNAIGVDGSILHELGHVWHSMFITPSELPNFRLAYTKIKNFHIAGKISEYAQTCEEETIAEIIKGLLSNDKYSPDVIALGNEITRGKLNELL